jgi:hypothetical protein
MLNKRREIHDDVLDETVRSLLAAAAAPTEPGPVPGEGEALAAFRASQTAPRRSLVLTYLASYKTAVAAALGTGVLLTAGVGAAAAGSLPGAAQDTASELLSKVGVTVPGTDGHSAGHADQRGGSEDAADQTGTDTEGSKGSEVSKLATSTEFEGVEKGAEVSKLASGGNSQAGEHGKAGDEHGKAGDEHGKAGEQTKGEESSSAARDDSKSSQTGEKSEKAAVKTPNDGGTRTADTATAKKADGASTNGTETADTASSDRSAEGSTTRP